MNVAPKPSSRLVSEAISYAVTHGILVGQSKTSPIGTDLSHAPFTIYPSSVPLTAYEHAIKITPMINTLISNIANDVPYLQTTLKETAQADPLFTGRLLSIISSTSQTLNRLQLSLCRYDYFIDQSQMDSQLGMVEMNCIAASFASLGEQTNQLHQYLNSAHPNAKNQKLNLPKNNALLDLVKGIAKAHQTFTQTYQHHIVTTTKNNHSTKCAAIMIVQPGERNAYDQYKIQSELWSVHNIHMIRVTLEQLYTNGRKLSDEHGGLFILKNIQHEGDQEREEEEEEIIVSVAYFRAGYTPDDYPSEKQWEGRELLEQSNAIKCPSIATQLVGTKKIQQVLSNSGELEKFLSKQYSQDDIDLIKQTFVTQLSLSPNDENNDVEKNVELAVNNPQGFVLKPQREGGGNNLYDDDMKRALLNMSSDERMAYIIMKRIHPVIIPNWIVRGGQLIGANGQLEQPVNVVSELGVFGVILFDRVNNQTVDNYAAGTLLRSKAALHNDGGVAAGVAVLDSPSLV